MREYKIVVDLDQVESFICFQREVNFMFFNSVWERMEESTKDHQGALDYIKSFNGKFIGTFMKDGTLIAPGVIIRPEKGQTYTKEGLPVRKVTREEVLNEGGISVFRKIMRKTMTDKELTSRYSISPSSSPEAPKKVNEGKQEVYPRNTNS